MEYPTVSEIGLSGMGFLKAEYCLFLSSWNIIEIHRYMGKLISYVVLLSVTFVSLPIFGQTLQLPFASSDYVEIPGGSTLSLVNRKDIIKNKTVDGSPYIYQTWENDSKVYFEDKVYTFKRFNYNAYAERFEAKISEDSVYIINPRGVDKVIIRDKVYRRYLDTEYMRNSYFEEILVANDFLFLRKHFIVMREPNINPLTKVPEGLPKLLHQEDYYVKKGANERLEKLRFRKKEVLKLISENSLKDVETYVKKHKLKYNNLHDVVSILKYYLAITT